MELKLDAVNVTMLVGLVALYFKFRQYHHENVARLEADAADRREIKVKMDLIYGWFNKYIVKGFKDDHGM